MMPTTERPSVPPAETPTDLDLPTAIRRAVAASDDPLTPAKIRAGLPSRFREASNDELMDCLRRQVAAGTLHQFPKYRSPQDRFWDRGMSDHVASLLREALQERALPWSELRRRLPAYALDRAEQILVDQVTQGRLYRHPPAGKRGGDRYGVRPPDAKEYLSAELATLFQRLQGLGFTVPQLRAGALELLHDEEWAPTPPPAPAADAPAESAIEPQAPETR
jgi:hypothetical protein